MPCWCCLKINKRKKKIRIATTFVNPKQANLGVHDLMLPLAIQMLGELAYTGQIQAGRIQL